MPLQTLIDCAGGKAGNTGISKCTRNMYPWIGGAFIPKGDGLTAAEAADLKTALAARAHNNNYAQRWHPFGEFNEITPQNVDEQTQEFQNGSRFTNREAYYSTRWRHLLGLCFHRALRQFEGREAEFDVILFDNKGNICGTERYNANDELIVGGIDLSRIHIPNLTQATLAEAVGFWFDLDFADATEINDRYLAMPAEDKNGRAFNPLSYMMDNAVRDVRIQNITPSGAAAGVFTLLVAEGCGDISLGTTFGSSLSAAMLNVYNRDTGAPITVTSLAVQANVKGNPYVLTLSVADPDYPTAGDDIGIGFTSVSALATGGLRYFEAQDIFVPAT